jgi:hypothetical protein
MTSPTRRIALALAISVLSALLAQAAALAQDDDCPLTQEQAQKSVEAFDKIAKVFTGQPRCFNCHGGVNPFRSDANKTHGGGKLQPVTKRDPNFDPDSGQPEITLDEAATFQQCKQCHSEFPGTWRIPAPYFSFVGKSAYELCSLEKEALHDNAEDFIRHIEADADPNNPFVQEAFSGRMGLNDKGQELALKYPAPPVGVTHQDLIQMAHDWVDAQGGKFQGDWDCGCKIVDKKNPSYLVTWHASAKGKGSSVTQSQRCEWSVDAGSHGTAVVRFKLVEGYPIFLDSRIQPEDSYVGEDDDRKTYVNDATCGTYLRERVYSSQDAVHLSGMNWWMNNPPQINVNGSWTTRPPANQAKGTWRLVNFFNAMAAFSHPNEASYTTTVDLQKCVADCVTEHLPGCVKWGPGYLVKDKASYVTVEQRAPNVLGWTWEQIGGNKFDVTSDNPDKFSIAVEGDVPPQYGCGSEGGKVHVKWEVTVERITPH